MKIGKLKKRVENWVFVNNEKWRNLDYWEI